MCPWGYIRWEGGTTRGWDSQWARQTVIDRLGNLPDQWAWGLDHKNTACRIMAGYRTLSEPSAGLFTKVAGFDAATYYNAICRRMLTAWTGTTCLNQARDADALTKRRNRAYVGAGNMASADAEAP